MNEEKPLRAQFYQDEAKKLREHAASEDKEHRRSVLLEIAERFENAAEELLEGKLE